MVERVRSTPGPGQTGGNAVQIARHTPKPVPPPPADISAGIREAFAGLDKLAQWELHERSKSRELALKDLYKESYAKQSEAGFQNLLENQYQHDSDARRIVDKAYGDANELNLDGWVEKTVNEKAFAFENTPDKLKSETLPELKNYIDQVKDPISRAKLLDRLNKRIDGAFLGLQKNQRTRQRNAALVTMTAGIQTKSDELLNVIRTGGEPDINATNEVFERIKALTEINPATGLQAQKKFLADYEKAKFRGYAYNNDYSDEAIETLNKGNAKWNNPITNKEEAIILSPEQHLSELNRARGEQTRINNKFKDEKIIVGKQADNLMNSLASGAKVSGTDRSNIINEVNNRLPKKSKQILEGISYADAIGTIVTSTTNAKDFRAFGKAERQIDEMAANIKVTDPNYNFKIKSLTSAKSGLASTFAKIQNNPWGVLENDRIHSTPMENEKMYKSMQTASGVTIINIPKRIIQQFDGLLADPDPNKKIDALRFLRDHRRALGDNVYKMAMEPDIKGVGDFFKKAVFENVNPDDIVATTILIEKGKDAAGKFASKDQKKIKEQISDVFGTVNPSIDTVKNAMYLAIQYGVENGREPNDEDVKKAVKDISYGDEFVKCPMAKLFELNQTLMLKYQKM